jgi:peptidoglycan/xylan/chitin deacetylase (PgdA/CDA1 family)
MLSRRFKQAIKSVFPLRLFLDAFHRELGMILMLHRVAPSEESKLSPNENMKITPQFLEELIIKLQKTYTFITLDELYHAIENKKFFRKKFAVFTFDDGYVDNYTNAFPIFKKYDIPFVIYLTAGLPDRRVALWWYIIEEIILSNESVELTDGSYYSCQNRAEKTETFMLLRNKIMKLSAIHFENELKNLLANYSIDYTQKTYELGLSWEQITEMSNTGLCTIAAHSVSHRTLNLLNEEDLVNEILGSKNRIESQIRKNADHFAYPFGTIDEVGIRELKILKNLKFKTASMAEGGKIYRNIKYDIHALPRVNITSDFTI